jgi:hypothetical protein
MNLKEEIKSNVFERFESGRHNEISTDVRYRVLVRINNPIWRVCITYFWNIKDELSRTKEE